MSVQTMAIGTDATGGDYVTCWKCGQLYLGFHACSSGVPYWSVIPPWPTWPHVNYWHVLPMPPQPTTTTTTAISEPSKRRKRHYKRIR